MKLRTILLLLAITTFVNAKPSHTLHAKLAKDHVMINFKTNTSKEMAESLTNGLLMRDPTQRPFKDVYVDFFVKLFESEEYIDDMAKVYMKHYSIKELAYVNKVYSDPKMLDYLKKQPMVVQETLIAGQKISANHMDELKSALAKKSKALQAISK